MNAYSKTCTHAHTHTHTHTHTHNMKPKQCKQAISSEICHIRSTYLMLNVKLLHIFSHVSFQQQQHNQHKSSLLLAFRIIYTTKQIRQNEHMVQ